MKKKLLFDVFLCFVSNGKYRKYCIFKNCKIHFIINLLKKEVEWRQIIDSYIYKLPNIFLFLYFEWEKYVLKYIKKILKRSNNWYRNPWFKLSYIDYNNCQYRKMKVCIFHASPQFSSTSYFPLTTQVFKRLTFISHLYLAKIR